MMKKLWGGRFNQKTSKVVESFTESISFDYRLWKHDIQGSIAHAKMLAKQGIITSEDASKIIKGLEEISKKIEKGIFKFKEELEDIHMNIEAALTEMIGDAGKKLHTARSRNDQIALDLRLYLRAETHEIISLIKAFQKSIIDKAENHLTDIMPGYTHMQRAQPVLLSHHLLSYVEMLQRDVERYIDSLKRINILPLGSCALAGTTFPIDRFYVAKLLGFNAVTSNSIDSVSDRDFAIEFLSISSILSMHLSRLAEELVIWSSEEFKFIEMPDAFTTGSSIMPQKKNPDVAELVRGKTGKIYGSLISLLTIMKGLPMAYNRDMQEDKIPVFDTVDTIKACLIVMNEMFPGIKFNIKRMNETAGDAFSTATDIAEYLVKKGMPFRNAHEITGKIVRHCINNGIKLYELSLDELKSFSDRFDSEIFKYLRPEESIKNKKSSGSTSIAEVKKQIKKMKEKVLL